MKHAYKTQLKNNLQQYYAKSSWIIRSNFSDDEILFIVPKEEDIRPHFDNLYPSLQHLPEIEHPNERVVIGFCHPDGSAYCFKVINPSSQDEIHMALLGQLPSRRISQAELQNMV